jgi:hypothetical protein
MHRMPPTTEPRSRNFLHQTFVWILAEAKTRNHRRCGSTPARQPGDVLRSKLEQLHLALEELAKRRIAR